MIPVHNSEKSLQELLEGIEALCINMGLSYEVIAVNDGSTDNSDLVLRQLLSKYFNLRIITLANNYGMQSATLCGLMHATGKYTVTMDDDLQYHPEDIRTLLFAIDRTNVKMLYGYAEKVRKNRFLRSVFKLSRKVVSGLSGLSLYQSSFRIIRTDALANLSDTNSFVFLIDSLLKKDTKPTSYVLVKHFQRKYGKSKYTVKRIFQMWFRYLLASSRFGELSAAALLLLNILLILQAKLGAALVVIAIAMLMIYLTFTFKYRIRKSFEIKEKVNFP